MKTNFTQREGRIITGVILLLSVSMAVIAQTTHNVAVNNNFFSPSELTIASGDEVVWTNQSGSHNVNGTQASYPSNPESFGNSVGTNWTYSYTFNTPGVYEYHCNPHLQAGMTGIIRVMEPSELTLSFSNMTPHLGQDLWIAIIESETGTEVARIKKQVEESFDVVFPGLESAVAYDIDFYADFNSNGRYDAPPADHAWRLSVEDVSVNDSIAFVHNTDFTDIEWQHRLLLRFMGMNPHVDQLLEFYLYDITAQAYVDTIIVDPVTSADFDLVSYGIVPGSSYNLDFYADHNGNGNYDAPPTDHAWRISLENILGDTVVEFSHNVNFTDISGGATGISPKNIKEHLTTYPNPASDFIMLKIRDLPDAELHVRILNLNGKEMLSRDYSSGEEELTINTSSLAGGLYFLELKAGTYKGYSKILISR